MFFRLSEPEAPSGMVLIPEGSFTIGDTLDGINDAIPTNAMVSAFYMDINLVRYAQWLSVYNWATNNGYEFDNSGSGKAANQPVQTVDWFDAVKWCNAQSRRAGLPPAYFTDINLTEEYTNGLVKPYVNWTNSGYRLPTEAEWEKAARGGLPAQRFPWGDTISEAQANYTSGEVAGSPPAYDLGPGGPNSIGIIGGTPYTSPVGSFGANGYGLYDVAGNVYEYCWDWYAPPPYPNGSPYLGGIDPSGPVTGAGSPFRVLRGGCWDFTAMFARCAARFYVNPQAAGDTVGFRCVRGY
jgi:formylglycine-generating enzyme required for sulfatase activity